MYTIMKPEIVFKLTCFVNNVRKDFFNVDILCGPKPIVFSLLYINAKTCMLKAVYFDFERCILCNNVIVITRMSLKL